MNKIPPDFKIRLKIGEQPPVEHNATFIFTKRTDQVLTPMLKELLGETAFMKGERTELADGTIQYLLNVSTDQGMFIKEIFNRTAFPYKPSMN